ncbi:hypothetical protein C8A05DRAFT_17864 [Staphylotrichum tortipilum]|uniref:Uncharacterized protein n=1 Tax=Staphylotrichum tortipilum TaxID=2831512 RepID=A0AAN6MGL8_9PEZI|nr:hypothetical protein C8A05DRAFT_17864 [Staphylotrichum longicolle]
MEHHPQPQLAPGLYVLDLEKPGEAHCGRGVGEALDVIRALEAHGIPCCVAGVKALVYYGAHRVPMNWEICVPTDSIERAKGLLASTPLSDKYELWHPVMPDVHSLAHTYPRFTLKGVNFFFILMPAFECRVDCSPDQCERSPSGIPYPKLERLAQGLLDTQLYADLTDLVDGMDLDEAWGETHLQLDGPPPIDYIREKNERIARALPASMKGEALLALLSERPRAREVWLRVVSTKQRRINDKMPRPRHLTRFRKIGSPDPREKQGREV